MADKGASYEDAGLRGNNILCNYFLTAQWNVRGWGAGRIASGGGERGELCFETRSPSPQPSGFPSPPLVSGPKGDVRFAQRGPPGEGGELAVVVL